MKNFRKVSRFLVALMLVLTLTACENSNGSYESSSEESKGDSVSVSAEETQKTSIKDIYNAAVETTEANSAASLDGIFSFGADTSNVEEEPLKLVDYGWYFSSLSYDKETAYIDFCGLVYNPNEELIAKYPSITVTVRNGDGSIVTTEEESANIVMPKDTITICGTLSILVSELAEDATIAFDVDWSEFGTDSRYYSPVRTTDFTITNVTARSGSSKSVVTGEIANNYSEELDLVHLSIVFRKDGEVVLIKETYLSDLKPGKTKAFEVTIYDELPEYDTIKVSARK